MGDISQNWLILRNGGHEIGLFQGLFERNSLTFNPGWDSDAQKFDTFTDVRELERQLKVQGKEFMSGAGKFCGNGSRRRPILVDQHV